MSQQELVESNSVGQVADADRHGRVRDLFTCLLYTSDAADE